MRENVCRPVYARFWVTGKAGSSRTFTADYETVDGTAVAGIDYVATAGTLSLEPGTRRRVIKVEILSDSVLNAPRTFSVKLGNAAGAVLGNSVAVATIFDRPQPAVCGPGF